jgi:DNA replication protein DnaC
VIAEETIQKLIQMRLPTMAQVFREILQAPPSHELTFEEQFGMLVDREWIERDNRRVARRVKEAKLPMAASLEAVTLDPARGIDKAMLRTLGAGQWIRAHNNVILVGATGVGKSFIGAALAQNACRQGFRSLCVRVPRLLQQLATARADGSYGSELGRLSRFDVLVLDDFLVAPMKDSERRDLFEVIEDRYDRSSTVITTQLNPKTWHEALGDPTIADAICDRLVHNAHLLSLGGPSLRKTKGLKSKAS